MTETEDMRQNAFNAALSFDKLIHSTQEQCRRANEDTRQFAEEKVYADLVLKKHCNCQESQAQAAEGM